MAPRQTRQSPRVAFITTKRASLKERMEFLRNYMHQNDNALQARLRFDRLTTMFHDYEELHDELGAIDPGNPGLQELNEIQDQFYAIAETIERQATATRSLDESLTSTSAERMKLHKLPQTELPKFHGDHTQWITFRNSFNSLVDSREDITNTVKFLYLKDCMQGDAAIKIAHLNASDESYAQAWSILKDFYERKRILVNQILDLIIETSTPSTVTPSSLTKICDDAKQHLSTLASLDIHPDQTLVLRLLERALPMHVRREWERKLTVDVMPTLELFYTFIRDTDFRMTSLPHKPQSSQASQAIKRKGTNLTSDPKAKRSDKGGRAFVTAAASSACNYCQQPHKIYKCEKFEALTVSQRWEFVKSQGLCKNCLRKHKEQYEDDAALMMSAVVRVPTSDNKLLNARALLDTCANTHLITAEFAKKLRLPTNTYQTSLGAVDDMNTAVEGDVNIRIQSTVNGFEKSLKCLIIRKICDFEPQERFPREDLRIPKDLPLADPNFHVPRPVDILIGGGATMSLIQSGQINVSPTNSDLILQKTRLGWALVGDLKGDSRQRLASCHLTQLNRQIEKFWLIEDVSDGSTMPTDSVLCEQHYTQNIQRDSTGRYIVRLPFRHGRVELGESRTQATRRFQSLQRKLSSKPEFKAAYHKVMQEYIDLGHMSLSSDESEPGFYIPHHAVFKESSLTTKLRVVFDASAKTSNGLSLNQNLMVGPTIQDKLFEHLVRFRTHSYVLTADIEKMYRQILIHPDDRKYQRVLWFQGDEIRTFELNTVAFGVSSAPFLAIRTVQQLANDEAHDFPRAGKLLKRDLYVDDLLTGANSLQEILEIRDEIIALLRRGQFNIRQWASNHQHALDNIHEKVFGVDDAVERSPVSKTLGITWNARQDKFIYTAKPDQPFVKFTKRHVLSEIAKIFDPLGLLGPIILYAKIFMQECWKLKLQWDDTLPHDLCKKWSAFTSQLCEMNEISVPRHLLIFDPINIEVHGFCDASKVGYGACLYVRSVNAKGHVLTRLVSSKSRVAPLKDSMTIPRLELCGALILSRLYKVIQPIFEFKIDRVIFWSDSTIALQWIKKSPQVLSVFESNRVREIQEFGEQIQWRHVETEHNPADALSRGQFPSDFSKNPTWFNGPSWLQQPESSWPKSTFKSVDDLPGLRKLAFLSELNGNVIFKRFSNYDTLVHSIAFCLRMLLKNKPDSGAGPSPKPRPISVTERRQTEVRILKLIQAEQYGKEIADLRKDRPIKSSKISALDPFLDDDGLLRVGGRLKNSNLTRNQKHPILLPTHHHVTDLIIDRTHKRNHHSGVQSTLFTMRQWFWLLDGKNQVRNRIRHCVECIRHRHAAVKYKMADLPKSRVQEASAFSHTGVDFFGPIYIKEKKERNRARVKAYGCVFICMSTKAVHLELVSDLSTNGFLGALRRFIGRKAVPAHVYSDNGKNFVGANHQLRELYIMLSSEQFRERVNAFSLRSNITWHFNPPESPHFGGIWEAAVKSFKHHLKRVLGSKLLTYEEMSTLLTEIEAILNSRPLYSDSTDPNDPKALTPADVLVGRPLNILPEDDILSVPESHLSVWRYITRTRQDFWKRWHLEYLSELQKRQKWHEGQSGLKEGSVVILIDKNRPCMDWELGRILEVHPGSDNISRVVTVKTARGTYKRNATTLCPLPAEE